MLFLATMTAVIVARNNNGEVTSYPVVEMEFHPEANQVEYVICPARIDDSIAKKAREIALKVVSDLDFVGLLAVEMFQTEDDKILVNEVAPRPHNTVHYTQDACAVSQFENHLRAVCGLPLGDTSLSVGAAASKYSVVNDFHGDISLNNSN